MLSSPADGGPPPGMVSLQVEADGSLMAAMRDRPHDTVPPDCVAISGPGVTLEGILDLCRRHKTARALRLSHCDLSAGALQQMRAGARWLQELRFYEVTGITESDVSEAEEQGWPRTFIFGRVGASGVLALTRAWTNAALPPMAPRSRQRAPPQADTTERPGPG